MNARRDSRRKRQIIDEGPELLAAGLGRERGCVSRSQLGDDWIERLPLAPRYGRRMRNIEDVAFLLDSVKTTWRDWEQYSGLYHFVDASYASAKERGLDSPEFASAQHPSYVLAAVHHLIEVRNVWAHRQDLGTAATSRALDAIHAVLTGFGAQHEAVEIRHLQRKLWRAEFADGEAERDAVSEAMQSLGGMEPEEFAGAQASNFTGTRSAPEREAETVASLGVPAGHHYPPRAPSSRQEMDATRVWQLFEAFPSRHYSESSIAQ